MQDAVVHSLTFSEKCCSQEASMSDSFLTFARKVKALTSRPTGHAAKGSNGHQALASRGIRFRGTLYSANIHKAVGLINQHIGNKEGEVLRSIEVQFGREPFNTNYSKLYRVLNIVAKHDGIATSTSDALNFVLESILVALQAGKMTARGLTVEALEGGKDRVGLVATLLARCQAPAP